MARNSDDAVLGVCLLGTGSTPPWRSTLAAAGYDMFYPSGGKSVIISPGCRALVGTGVSVQIPTGWYGQIKPRSSLACRGITTDAGVIDSDYRGEVKVILVNHSQTPHEILPGDKIAQMVLLQHGEFPVVITKNLTATDRGTGGFGSTGR